LSPPPSQEGEFYNINKRKLNSFRTKTTQDVVYESMYVMSDFEKTHDRDAFDFLLFLANIGGVQLILDLIFSKIVAKAAERKSLYDILKRFFYVKTTEKTFLQHKHAEKADHYRLKINSTGKTIMVLSNTAIYYCIPCLT